MSKWRPAFVAAALLGGVALAPPAAAAEVGPQSGSGFFEIISVDPTGIVRAWRNAGGLPGPPYTQPPQSIGSGWPNPFLVKFGDLDGDTYDEIISVDISGSVRVWRNVNGTYPGTPVLVGTGWTDAGGTFFADINGDSRDEIVSVRLNGEVWAWRNVNRLAPDTYREPPIRIGAGFDRLRTYFADINGDSRDEIIALQSSGNVLAWRNVNGFNGPPYTEPPKVIGTGWLYDRPGRIKFADLTNDKRHEIINVNTDNGNVHAWRNVNGLNSPPYTQPPILIGTGWSLDHRVFFAEIFS